MGGALFVTARRMFGLIIPPSRLKGTPVIVVVIIVPGVVTKNKRDDCHAN